MTSSASSSPSPLAGGHSSRANDEAFGADPARPLRTPRGPLTWVELLEAQRLHCAQHYRQATTRLASLGLATPSIELEALYGLRLPASVY